MYYPLMPFLNLAAILNSKMATRRKTMKHKMFFLLDRNDIFLPKHKFHIYEISLNIKDHTALELPTILNIQVHGFMVFVCRLIWGILK